MFTPSAAYPPREIPVADNIDAGQPQPPRPSVLRRINRRVKIPAVLIPVVATAIAVSSLSLASSAVADCTTNTDTCTVDSWYAQTPLGPVDITVSASHVVTVHLSATNPYTKVFGIPVAFPPGPTALPGYSRTTVDTTGGTVFIDSAFPSGPTRPGLTIISIHPPSPCRANTSQTTVVFTPRSTTTP